MIQEVAIGYIIGFILSLLIEAAAFAGQFLGSLMGMAGAELFDPIQYTSQPLLAKLFAFMAFGLFLLLDGHHLLLRFLFDTFTLFPLGAHLSHAMATTALEATTLLFSYVIKFALIPLSFLLPLLIFLAILSRFFPIFWLSFPLQFIVGTLVLSQCTLFYLPLIENGINAFFEILKKNLIS